MSTIIVNTLTNSTNTVYIPVETIRTKEAYANFYYSVNDAAGDLTIANTGTYGATMAFNNVSSQLNITGNIDNYTWTHTHTGKYIINVLFRQHTGGDIWTVLAVCKNGPAEAVGVSGRVGSRNSVMDNFNIFYEVDSTSATYQLQHWATGTKTVWSDFTTTPGWTNYNTLIGSKTGDTGRMVDYIIRRLGD